MKMGNLSNLSGRLQEIEAGLVKVDGTGLGRCTPAVQSCHGFGMSHFLGTILQIGIERIPDQ